MKIEFEKKSYFEVACKSDVDELFKGRSQIVKGIKQLIPLIIEFCDTDYLSKNFNAKRSVEHQFYNLIRNNFYSTLHTKLNISICKVNSDYALKAIWRPNIRYFEFHLVPLGFLPHLEKSNKKMFNLVFDTIALLCKTCEVSFIEGFLINDNLEEYEEVLVVGDGSEHLKEDIELYKVYAEKYMHKLNTGKYSLQSIEKRLANFSVSFKTEETILEWIRLMLTVIETNDNLTRYDEYGIERIIDDAFESGIIKEGEDPYNLFDNDWPLQISYIFAFTWFNEGFEKGNSNMYINEIAGNFQLAEYYEEFICSSKKQVNEAIKFASENENHFLCHLEKAMDFGFRHIDEICDYAKNNHKLINIL